MKTLQMVVAALVLACVSQVANATSNSGGHTGQTHQGEQGSIYVGYWRTNDHHGGYEKNDNMYEMHNRGWNNCWNECKEDDECYGVEYSSGHDYDRCEVHYDAFAHCERTQSNDGSRGDMSTCWVKADSPRTATTSYEMPEANVVEDEESEENSRPAVF